MKPKLLLLCFLLPLFGIAAKSPERPARVWETKGFEAFQKGQFDASGANLYVSRKGVVQTIHRFDLNNDGYFDLVFNNTHDLVYRLPAYEYRFKKDDRKPTRFDYPGIGSVRVRSADLNGDGFPDLVIARGFDDSSQLHNSWVYWGTPSGWSARQHMELPTPYVQDVCIGDFNHDGRPDLAFIASSSFGANSSLIYWGGKDGYFSRDRTALQTPGANGCLAVDLDGDGYADLVVTAAGRQSEIFWGGPQGLNQQKSSPLPEGSILDAARLASNHLVVTMSKGLDVLKVQSRTVGIEQTVPFEGAGKVAVGELNGDRVPDLVVTREDKGQTWETRHWATTSRIFWGREQGGKDVFSATSHTDLPTLGASDVAISDVDKDGYPDIVFANMRTHLSYDVPSYIYWGGPKGYSVTRRSALPTHGAKAVSVLGQNVFFANSISGRATGDIDSYIYYGDKQGMYSTKHMQRIPTIGGYESCLADFNDDGYPDLLTVTSTEGDPGRGNAIGSFIYWGGKEGLSLSRRTEIPTSGAIGCAVADVNQDGYLDILSSNMDNNTVSVLYGGPDGFSDKRQTVLKVNGPRFPAIADLNKDGYLDLVVPSIREDWGSSKSPNTEGLYIFWGSAKGYSATRRTVLPSVGPVSVQIADLNSDGYLDLVVCDLADLHHRVYHGVNTYIYWGSPQGYSVYNRTELPSLGAHYATIGDFNRDGFLDIFISNYQSEFTRDLNSYIYWGNRKADYTVAHRQALHVGSAAGIESGDFNGDGWIDLAVSNHVKNGDHHARSFIFWNGPKGFSNQRVTRLPTVGPHMMTGVDQGNIYTRALKEAYISAPYDAGVPLAPYELHWTGATPFGSTLDFEIRDADSSEALKEMPWKNLGYHTVKNEDLPVAILRSRRWWQFRVILADGDASSPRLTDVRVDFRAPRNEAQE